MHSPVLNQDTCNFQLAKTRLQTPTKVTWLLKHRPVTPMGQPQRKVFWIISSLRTDFDITRIYLLVSLLYATMWRDLATVWCLIKVAFNIFSICFGFFFIFFFFSCVCLTESSCVATQLNLHFFLSSVFPFLRDGKGLVVYFLSVKGPSKIKEAW